MLKDKHLMQLASMTCTKMTYQYALNMFRLETGLKELMNGEQGMQVHNKMLNKFELSNLN